MKNANNKRYDINIKEFLLKEYSHGLMGILLGMIRFLHCLNFMMAVK